MKICKDCKLEKPLDEFYKSNRGTYGVDTYCKSCRSQRNEKYRREVLADPYLAERRRKAQRESYRRSYRKNPQRLRAKSKRSREKRWLDPEKRERERELARINYRLKKERQGVEVGYGKARVPYLEKKVLVDATEFLEWIDSVPVSELQDSTTRKALERGRKTNRMELVAIDRIVTKLDARPLATFDLPVL